MKGFRDIIQITAQAARKAVREYFRPLVLVYARSESLLRRRPSIAPTMGSTEDVNATPEKLPSSELHAEEVIYKNQLAGNKIADIGKELKRDQWHWPMMLAAEPAHKLQLQSLEYEVVAPYQSPAEEAVTDGTRRVELRLSTKNRVWTLWVQLTGAAAEGRLARFTIESPPGGVLWKIVCFVGTDENGIGELSLSIFDSRRLWKLAPGCSFILEPLLPQVLQPDDRGILEKSRDASLVGRRILESILEGLPEITDSE